MKIENPGGAWLAVAWTVMAPGAGLVVSKRELAPRASVELQLRSGEAVELIAWPLDVPREIERQEAIIQEARRRLFELRAIGAR